MKKIIPLCFAGVATFLFLVSQETTYGKKKMSHIVSKIWYNFEEGDPSDFDCATSAFGIKEKTGVARVDFVPSGLGESRQDSKQSLHIWTAFERKGYNWIDIFPKDDNRSFPGIVKSFDMWVWGANFLYNLELVLEDYRGYVHSLSMGDLQYFGWRNKNIVMPTTIPQEDPYAPRMKGLRFKKWRIYSTPNERVDRFDCFFDFFKIVTDNYREQYDGWEIEKYLENIINNRDGKKASPATNR